MAVLYCAQHPTSIMRAVTHKLAFHADDEADVIFITDWFDPGKKIPVELYYLDLPKVRYSFFETKRTIAYQKLFDSGNSLDFLENAHRIVNDFRAENGIDTQSYSERYVLYDWIMPFTPYFLYNHLSFDVILMSPRLLRQPLGDPAQQAVRNREKIFLHFFDERNGQIKRIWVDKNSDWEKWNYRIPDIRHFAVEEALAGLSGSAKEQLQANFTKSLSPQVSCLVILNSPAFAHKGNLGKALPWLSTNKEVFRAYYSISIDYYFPDGNVAVKYHPLDLVLLDSDDEILIPNAGKYPFNFYSELWTLFPDTLPQSAFCFNFSTGLSSLAKQGVVTQSLGRDYVDFFHAIHFVYAALNIARRQNRKLDVIHVDAVNLKQISLFRDYAFKDLSQIEFILLTQENVSNAKYVISNSPDCSLVELLPNDCTAVTRNCCKDSKIGGVQFCMNLILNGKVVQSDTFWMCRKGVMPLTELEQCCSFSRRLNYAEMAVVCFCKIRYDIRFLARLFQNIQDVSIISGYNFDGSLIERELISGNNRQTFSPVCKTGDGTFIVADVSILMAKTIDYQIPVFRAVSGVHFCRSVFALVGLDHKKQFASSIFNSGYLANRLLLVKAEIISNSDMYVRSVIDHYIHIFTKDSKIYEALVGKSLLLRIEETDWSLLFTVIKPPKADNLFG